MIGIRMFDFHPLSGRRGDAVATFLWAVGLVFVAGGSGRAQPQVALADVVSVSSGVPLAEDAQRASVPGVPGDYLELSITNRSRKGIVAYAIDLTAYGKGGPRGAGTMTYDLVSSFGAAALTGGEAPSLVTKYDHVGPLRPGQTYYEFVRRVPDEDGKSVAEESASVRAVLFDDNSIAGDGAAVEGLLDEHRGEAAELEAIVKELRAPSPVRIRDRIASWRQRYGGPASALGARAGASRWREMKGRNDARRMFVYSLDHELQGDDEKDLDGRVERLARFLRLEAEGFRQHSGTGAKIQ